MVTEDVGLPINVQGVPVGWVEFDVRDVKGVVEGRVTMPVRAIEGVQRSGGAAAIWWSSRLWFVHESYEEVFRRIAAADTPEVKEPMTRPLPAPLPSYDGVPVRKKVKA